MGKTQKVMIGLVGTAVLGAAAWLGRGGSGGVEDDSPALEAETPVAEAEPETTLAQAPLPVVHSNTTAATQGSATDEEPYDPEPVDEAAASEVFEEERRALIRPLITAIRGDFATGRERRDAMLSALRQSGPTAESWTAEAPSTFAGLRRALPTQEGVEVDFTHTECFRAGCAATVRFNDMASYERAAAGYREINEAGAKHGGRVQTPAVALPGGGVEASWIVLRPHS